MKRNLLKACFTIAIAATIVITGCKYEDGPGISARSKRDRLANEWKITNYTIGGEDNTSIFEAHDQDTYALVFTLTRSGAYFVLEDPNYPYAPGSLYWLDPEWKKLYDHKNEMLAALGLADNDGKWSFYDSHNKFIMGEDLSNESLYREYEIQELREDQIKFSWVDANDTKHSLTFKPLNDEDFFL